MLNSGLADVDVEEVCGNLELVAGKRGGQRLPLQGWADGLPMSGVADLHGHGEAGFVCTPLVGDGVAGLIKVEFEQRDVDVAQVLVEDWGKVQAGFGGSTRRQHPQSWWWCI